ncbi:hypothetical protein AOC36_03525 [Erysipelothrix larvae]|uniref:HTH cro/C1-type domain-containing protein n=1 Tax=Erysipelothrix larvae TaxID=1514105 RepID=A0A0X8GZ75_9FIRM|nr:helix-turn-helix transcriptional regulator [Erysipelothrix larvae]AMC93079.1 hypothetical protein AOC36_03525 [Erysipelothrix larvae]
MNQQKIGEFLKRLRQEKALTQEQFSELLNVSRRTVSRWETGSNLPDISILIELADFFEVDLREILDGERKSERMNKELEETVHKVVDYSKTQQEKLNKRMHLLFMMGLMTFLIFCAMYFGKIDSKTRTYEHVSGFLLGVSLGVMIIGVMMTSKFSSQIRNYKMRILQHRRTDNYEK